MTYLDRIPGALLTVTSEVYHFRADTAATKYIVWAEDGGGALMADDRPAERYTQGTVDYFTPDESDPDVSRIAAALEGVSACYLNSVQYEDDTGLIHWEWVWSCG